MRDDGVVGQKEFSSDLWAAEGDQVQIHDEPLPMEKTVAESDNESDDFHKGLPDDQFLKIEEKGVDVAGQGNTVSEGDLVERNRFDTG